MIHIDRFNGVDYTMQRERMRRRVVGTKSKWRLAEENAMGKPNNDTLRRMLGAGA